MSQCKKFAPNIFHKTKCSNCFRQKEEHSAEALECNRASRSVARSGYLFVAPDWDFSVPLNRTKRWQRRWFVLYDDGELNYSVDEHPDTVPQGSVDMSKVLEVTGAEQVTGHPHSLALTSPDRVTFVKAASREDARWWAELLAVFPRRHKRNATFPGGRASPSLPQLGRSASPQPPRPSRHLGPAQRTTNFETPPLKEEKAPETTPGSRRLEIAPLREDKRLEMSPLTEERSLDTSPLREDVKPFREQNGECQGKEVKSGGKDSVDGRRKRPDWLPEPSVRVPIEGVQKQKERQNQQQQHLVAVSERNDYIMSSGSPPTRDKLRCDDKAKARRDWTWRTERFKDIATALTDRSPESSLALPSEGLLHLKKGWLWVRNSNNDWLKRWVVLCAPTLSIYQLQDEQSTPETVIELSSVMSYNEIPTDTKYGFEIHCGDGTLTLSAVTTGIRSNWLQALQKAAPLPVDSPLSPATPVTPTKLLLSSDEEYRTASEGGRRGSEDWTDLPPSPPLNKTSLLKSKEKVRLRPRLPRCQSRQSTLDSTSTDELDSVKESDNVELHNVINKQNVEIDDLHKQLVKATDEIRTMEEEIARLKELQSDAVTREKKLKDQLSSLEQSERELNQRNLQTETKFLREQRSIQKRLLDAEESAKNFEERYNVLSRELLSKQRIVLSLQEELSNTNEKLAKSRQENDKLFKRIQELEGKYHRSSKRLNSLTDLTNIDLEVDIDTLGLYELKEYCLDLKGRFEKAVLEIRAVKKQLRESYEIVDKLELKNHGLENSLEVLRQESQAEIDLLGSRLDHLTTKLSAAEKQLRHRSKIESKDKRRSLSLKGRESFSINKEVEDKVTELEAKIVALERDRTRRKLKRERSSERGSPIDERAQRRLRRKSLDSATSSEPMKLLMRLNNLESKVTGANTSTESLNVVAMSCSNSMSDLTKCVEESTETSGGEVPEISAARRKISECLRQIVTLKNRTRRASSPTFERLTTLEHNLNELSDILSAGSSVSDAEIEVINSSAAAVVCQLQKLLADKLRNLEEKKRKLRESDKLDRKAKLQILAEKVAFENVLIGRIQEALTSPANGEAVCERLMVKEIKETAHLMNALHEKLKGSSTKSIPMCKTGAEYLTGVLSRCLISACHSFENCQNFLANNSSSIKLLQEEQKKLHIMLVSYKSSKLPLLAEALATETINLSSSDKACRSISLYTVSEDIIGEFNRAAREKVNEELIKNEISHVFLRAARIYKDHLDKDHPFFFSFFAAERAAMELFSDSVRDSLYLEIEKSVEELKECYRSCLNKLQRQNWRRKVESERRTLTPSGLLEELADVVAHKALVDARIKVLSGEVKAEIVENGRDVQENCLTRWIENDSCWDYLSNNAPATITASLEAEFLCMVERGSRECAANCGGSSPSILSRPLSQKEVDAVLAALEELTVEVATLQRLSLPEEECVNEDRSEGNTWESICQRCTQLRDMLEKIRQAVVRRRKLEESGGGISSSSAQQLTDQEEEDQHRSLMQQLAATPEYLGQVESLRAAYRNALSSTSAPPDLYRLQELCERALAAIEHWHRRTVADLREVHARELEALRRDKEQALAEETQATLAALDAMRKAHEAEVQREVSRFKQELLRQQRDEVTTLSERLSVKCLEAAALEEQLGTATRQLAHAQQHILRLERNPQLSMQN